MRAEGRKLEIGEGGCRRREMYRTTFGGTSRPTITARGAVACHTTVTPFA